jgi:hypothetical protein
VNNTLANPKNRVSEAVAHYWLTRQGQAEKQAASGQADQGARSAVTGGAQMDGFINLITDLIIEAGVNNEYIFYNRYLELPGFFRPTKEWDLLVVRDGQLIIALEAKSQVGPSFGNNFNNRTEEAMGSALDLWTAYREGAFNKTVQPWLGYFFSKTVQLPGHPSKLRSHILRYFQSSLMHLMLSVTRFFAESWLEKGITMLQLS